MLYLKLMKRLISNTNSFANLVDELKKRRESSLLLKSLEMMSNFDFTINFNN